MRVWTYILGLVLVAITNGRSSLASDDHKTVVTIIVRHQGSDLVVDYRLSKPVSEMAFDRTEFGVRAQRWHVRRWPDLEVGPDKVSLSNHQKFQAFRVHIEPGDFLRNPQMGDVAPLDKDNVFFGPEVLIADRDKFESHVCIEDKPGVCDGPAPGTPGPYKIAASGWLDVDLVLEGADIFMGPGPIEDLGGFDAFHSSDFPVWAAKSLERSVAKTIGFYQDTLGIQLARKPAFFMMWLGGGDDARYGCPVDKHSVIIGMSVGSSHKDAAISKAVSFLRDCIRMTAGMMYSYGRFGRDEMLAKSWFYDGATSFWKIQLEAEKPDPYDSIVDELGIVTRSCVEAAAAGADVPYACGDMVQWLADAMVRRQSGGQQTVLTVWHDIFSQIPAQAPWPGMKAFVDAMEPYDPKGNFAAVLSKLDAKQGIDRPAITSLFEAAGRSDLTTLLSREQ